MSKPILLTLGLIFAAAGCSAPGTGASDSGATATTSSPGPGATTGGPDLAAYPEIYRTMDLPALPGATITSTGRQATALRDGLAIRLTTSTSVAEAREYYRRELAARGWTEQAGPGQTAQAMLPNLPLARLAFARGPLLYTATITANDGTARVDITLVEP